MQASHPISGLALMVKCLADVCCFLLCKAFLLAELAEEGRLGGMPVVSGQTGLLTDLMALPQHYMILTHVRVVVQRVLLIKNAKDEVVCCKIPESCLLVCYVTPLQDGSGHQNGTLNLKKQATSVPQVHVADLAVTAFGHLRPEVHRQRLLLPSLHP